MVNSVADSGHAYARRYASSTLTPAMAHSEIYGGMTQVDFMNKLANTEDLSDVISKLKVCGPQTCGTGFFQVLLIFCQQLIASLVLKQSSLRVAVTCDDSVVGKNEQALTKFLSSLSKDSVSVPSELVSCKWHVHELNLLDTL
jgi:Zn-dependent M16 (insulinase) family peptidase